MTKKSENREYLVIFRHPVDMPEPTMEEMQKIFEKWKRWIDGLKAKGQSSGGMPLEDAGRVLRGSRGATITDGPFSEGKEVVGGYIIVNAPSLAEAAEIAKGCPGLEVGQSVEVREATAMPA